MHDVGYFEVLENYVRKYNDSYRVCVIGDLNARTADRSDIIESSTLFDRYVQTIDTNYVECPFDLSDRKSEDHVCNASGLKLLDICRSSDLKIINGRKGDDADIGRFTFQSTLGRSVIDYVIASYHLFPIISDFIVHDSFTYSAHVPIQVNFKVESSNKTDNVKLDNVQKLVWDVNKVDVYNNILLNDCDKLNDIVSQITSSNVSISDGVKSFANELYNIAYQVFGVNKTVYSISHNRKHENPWFTGDCYTAKHELNRANKIYRKTRTNENYFVVINKRRFYRNVQRKAKYAYARKQRSELHIASKNNPKKFWDLVRKYKKKCKNNSNLSANDFYEHFKSLFSDNDVFMDQDVESTINDDTLNTNVVEMLDCDFTIEEVAKAIGTLKRQKSAGVDMLIPEIFLDSKHILAPLLCKLFNFMYTNCVYPENWTKGIIVPVPKKGDLNNVDNYRGIMLTSIFSKIFSQILDTRARTFVENNNVLSDCQYGFRQKRSTVDCIYVLQSLLNRVIRHEKRRLYCAFVDFKKAFDLVYRNGIWFKLLKYQLSSKFINMLKTIYQSVKSCVRSNGNMSNYFDSYMGVKQGETLSPLLFILFINDIEENVKDVNADLVTLDEMQIFMLLFCR
ncbi:uncharacterized protein LOC123554108 isoform X1 [Mercenaria mercenaria]|uniref:uncharacterized protein LOC123554108 isoform X1 n=1 Tax=Mercenaria mercenaria TaxID=6596 RepID=UPI00234E460D|nr:uncharacterized protein LOC123554108 isoform X1 [Mercenaria mercenaria]XP_053375117.1 uncharacterized protein LOC123554108 isoform X1 [Mercenaria mercenaria]XP_053375118.1 uncharacterized protein LOC123554108 isoform X1 [Mercenaria mercenaria]XP_053375119.1 uncharacterized protein LOC123554108 isoform X1 [Mercenaria mercenaria]